jgi:hypothetical protein
MAITARRTSDDDFYSFCRDCCNLMNLGELLNANAYAEAYSIGEDIAEARIKRAAIVTPLTLATSFVIEQCMPAWVLAHNPYAIIFEVRAEARAARSCCRDLQKITRSTLFRRWRAKRIDYHSRSGSKIARRDGGNVRATAFGEIPTGLCADLIIVEGPTGPSPNRFSHITRYFDYELIPRLRSKDSCAVVLGEQASSQTLLGHVAARGDFRTIKLE